MGVNISSLMGSANREETEQRFAALEARLGMVEQRLAILVGMEAAPAMAPVSEVVAREQQPKRIKALETAKAVFPAKLGELRANCQKMASEIESSQRECDNALQEQLEEEQGRAREADRFRLELEEARQQQLAVERFYGQLGLRKSDLEQLLRTFTALPAPFHSCVEGYYNLQNLPIFFSQCGQVSRLRQCWAACRELILKDTTPGNVGEALALLMEIYNRASPDNMCELFSAQPGDCYDFNIQERLGAQGTKIAQVILPGLRLPNGSIACKCQVTLA